MDSQSGRWLALDLRSLAAFRIVLGMVLLLDLAVFRVANLEAFYTDAGIVPPELQRLLGASQGYTALVAWTPMLWLSGTASVALFFGATGAAYLALLLGWRTRLAAVLSFLGLWSIQHRCSVVIETDDRMLLCLLFWAAFLPLDARFALRLRRGSQQTVWSVASVGLVVQVVLIYLCNGLPKTGPTWVEGVALTLSPGAVAPRATAGRRRDVPAPHSSNPARVDASRSGSRLSHRSGRAGTGAC